MVLVDRPSWPGTVGPPCHTVEQEFEEVGTVAVTALVDEPAVRLWSALDDVRTVPAPVGQVAGRLGTLARSAAELRGVYLRDLAEAHASGEAEAAGCRSVADLLVESAGMPVWQARSDVALARRLAVLPGLLDAVAGGGLELDAAKHLARAWSALPSSLRDRATAEALVALGGLVDLADLKDKVDELLAALQPEVTDEAVRRPARAPGSCSPTSAPRPACPATPTCSPGSGCGRSSRRRPRPTAGSRTLAGRDARLLDALLDIVRAAVGTPVGPRYRRCGRRCASADPRGERRRRRCGGGVEPDRVDPADSLADLLGPGRRPCPPALVVGPHPRRHLARPAPAARPVLRRRRRASARRRRRTPARQHARRTTAEPS